MVDRCIQVGTVLDGIMEGAETFTITMEGGNNLAVGSINTITVFLIDRDGEYNGSGH